MRPIPESFDQCPDCKSLITPQWGFHYCVTEYKNGKAVRGVTKYYNTTTQVWEVQPNSLVVSHKEAAARRGVAHYDAKTGAWKEPVVPDAEDGYEVASCELPPRIVPESTKTETPANNPYKPAEPWEGLNRAIWPNTFQVLLMFHYDRSYWGLYITNEEYRDRILRGIYAPERRYGNERWDQETRTWKPIVRDYGTKKPEETPTGTKTEESIEENAGNPYAFTHWSDHGEG